MGLILSAPGDYMKLNQKILALPVNQTLAQDVTLRTLDELEVIVIDTAFCQAAITLQGAHLLLWQPATQKLPVLWLSDVSPFKTGVAIRGGVPLCWPWFTDKGGQPHHGIARILPWKIEDIYARPRSVQVTLSLSDTAESRAMWDHHFHLALTFTFTDNLCELMLTMQGEFVATPALHGYFYTKDVSRLAVCGLGTDGLDTLDGVSRSWPQPFAFDGETAVIFTSPEPKSLVHDASGARYITITHFNHSDVVAWNPGEAKTRGIADIPDVSWKHFACVETARISHPLSCSWQKPGAIGVQFRVNATGEQAVCEES